MWDEDRGRVLANYRSFATACEVWAGDTDFTVHDLQTGQWISLIAANRILIHEPTDDQPSVRIVKK